jgi:hypothetical protein
MLHLPPAHHETSKRDSPNEVKIKEKQNKIVPDLNSNITKLMTHHNQINELIYVMTIDDKLRISKNRVREQ